MDSARAAPDGSHLPEPGGPFLCSSGLYTVQVCTQCRIVLRTIARRNAVWVRRRPARGRIDQTLERTAGRSPLPSPIGPVIGPVLSTPHGDSAKRREAGTYIDGHLYNRAKRTTRVPAPRTGSAGAPLSKPDDSRAPNRIADRFVETRSLFLRAYIDARLYLCSSIFRS